jgi:hypothetical protein
MIGWMKSSDFLTNFSRPVPPRVLHKLKLLNVSAQLNLLSLALNLGGGNIPHH